VDSLPETEAEAFETVGENYAHLFNRESYGL